MKASLYIHVPFCARKCAYCDFESYAGRLGRADEYIDQVIKETKSYDVCGVPTAFLGGGTPSLLEPEQLKRLISGVFEHMPPDSGAEVTMECNPGTVTREKLRTALECGVNRLSFGVQAAQARLLEMLGRIHTFDAAVSSVKLAQDCGFTNISCDVMYALPGQKTDDLMETVRRITDLGVTHISCYSLILEEGTRLFGDVEAGKLILPDEDGICLMQGSLLSELRRLGFHRYEISNYSKTGFESRHNCVYWEGGDYLGLGCAAHSFTGGERFSNPDFDAYMKGVRHIDSEFVDEYGRLEEKLLLGTRMTKGIELNELPEKAKACVIKEASKPVYRQLVTLENGRLAFTDAGLMVHNELVLRFTQCLRAD